MGRERLIKKYANRRLYDASISKHVTLADIRGFVSNGEKVRVIEDKTGQDITRLIMLQVIAEQEQFGRPMLSTALLESIIRCYDGPLEGNIAGYLEMCIRALASGEDDVATGTAASPAPKTPTDIVRRNLDSWKAAAEGGSAAGTSAAPDEALRPGQESTRRRF